MGKGTTMSVKRYARSKEKADCAVSWEKDCTVL